MAKILLRSGIPELRRNGPPTSDIRIHFGRAYLAGRRREGAFGRRSLLKRGIFMSPPYGWPIAGRYCATAGFFYPPCGMAVTLSFGRREGLGLSQTMLFDSLLGRLTVAAFVASNRDKIAKGDRETEFPLRWMQKDMHLASANERQPPSLSKEVAHGHSEVAVINLSDARWLLRKAKSDYKTIIVGMRD